jgi:polyketide biosynthesis 3-hydroxy-3-methylglutaryl-CoA synthase-like enzyme PksG
MEEYESTFETNGNLKFGTRNYKTEIGQFSGPFKCIEGSGKLVFSEIKDYHRVYKWV